MRLALCMIAAAALACSGSDNPGGDIDAGDGPRPDAALGTIGPEQGAYSLRWTCATACEGGAPFEYFDELFIDREATPIELTFHQRECGEACDYVDTATLSDPCVDGTGIDLGGGLKTDPYSLCPNDGGPSTEVVWRGFPGPNVEKTWIGQATPIAP